MNSKAAKITEEFAEKLGELTATYQRKGLTQEQTTRVLEIVCRLEKSILGKLTYAGSVILLTGFLTGCAGFCKSPDDFCPVPSATDVGAVVGVLV